MEAHEPADAHEPAVRRTGGFLCAVTGTFHRAVDRRFADTALAGSRAAGRYSRAGQPTLYLSASRAGVDAALIAHRRRAAKADLVLSVRVQASAIFDLRDAAALARVRAAAGDPLAEWQQAVGEGRTPASWLARDWIEAQGARGLIDPSRKAPGLWHLVLFRWNAIGDARLET